MIYTKQQVARWIEEDAGTYRDELGRYLSKKRNTPKVEHKNTNTNWIAQYTAVAFMGIVVVYLLSIFAGMVNDMIINFILSF